MSHETEKTETQTAPVLNTQDLIAEYKVEPYWKKGLDKAQADYPLAKADKAALAKTLISRYVDGTDMNTLAEELGVTRKRLYQILIEQNEEGWKSAQVTAALDRLEKAKELMDSAQTALDIARARESAKIAQWELERTCRRIYGQDVPAHLGSGTVHININTAQPQVIDIQGSAQSGKDSPPE